MATTSPPSTAAPSAAGNPWTATLAAARASVYIPNPPQSFHVRLMVLNGVAGLALIGALLHLILVLLDIKRRGWRKTRALWFVRSANLSSGRYLVTNTKLISALLSIVNLPLIIADLHNIQSTTFEHGSQVLTTAFRSLLNVPLLIHLTLLTYGQLQAYILTGQPARLRRASGTPWLSANVVNWSLISTMVMIVGGLLIPAIYVSIIGAVSWNMFVQLEDLLAQLNASWNGVVDFRAVAQLGVYKAKLDTLGKHRLVAFSTAFVFGDLVCFILVIINFGALLLPYLVRRTQPALAEHYVEDGLPAVQPSSVRRPSTAVSLAISLEKSDLAQLAEREVTKRREALLTAEHDLITTCSWLLLVSTVCFILALWLLCEVVVPNSFSRISWAGREAALTMVHWLYSLLHLFSFPIFVYRAYQDLHSAQRHTAIRSNRRRSRGSNLLRPRSAAQLPSGGGLVRVKVVVEETEDFKLDAPIGRLETVIQGGKGVQEREQEQDLILSETAPVGGALGEGLVPWHKPDWASTLHVPLDLIRQASRVSSNWEEEAPDLPTLTTLEAAVPWEWQAGPAPPKSPK
ncbi:hypothetical protein BCR35DRAFT_13587 [Leucosporidium creatinivorum]|uniref:Uncharacterized protein n=1 Tax=Leucosporidium creatinivorum TaxID=106004 RepID=A0A1Y2FYL2_9BASI|nr:hypothetical protein BCR35DRAFT_13587 [Leucosporidium creatinivorum]